MAIRRFVSALACISCLSVSFISVPASTWISPRRPLTEDERLGLAVSEADAVLFAFVVSSRDTIAASGYESRSLVLRPISFLKGSVDAPELLVGVLDTDVSRSPADDLLARRPPGVVLAFLRRFHEGWLLSGNPNGVSGGLLAIGQGELEQLRARTIIQIRRQSLDSLVAQADLVVVGRRLGKNTPCTLFGRQSTCPTIAVDSVLSGSERARDIRVYSLAPGHIPAGPALLFLRRMPGDSYETIGFQLGSLEIGPDAHVRRLGMGLTAIGRHVAELRSKKQLPGNRWQ